MAEAQKPAQTNTGMRQEKTYKRGEDLSSYVFGKVQPQAVPLEEAVLGALMLDKEALPVIVDILRAESFYLDAHKAIYKAMLHLFEKSQPIDLLTVTEELRKAGDLELVGGPVYIVELTNKVASAANIEYHARIISQKFIQRELITVSTKVIRDAFEDTTDVFQLLDDAEQGLFAIAQQNMSRGYDSMSTLASKALKQIEEMKNQEGGLTGVPTGFTELDRLTSGFQPSDLIILAARPGMGKCLGKGTKVLMYDGQLKKVEDVLPGEYLMGPDSAPRKVLSIARGREKMYWIRQNKGIDYRVNESHILSLKKSRQEGKEERGSILNITVEDWLKKTKKFQNNYKGYKTAVEFESKATSLPPYFVGLWLGDGTKGKSQIATQDTEVVTYLEEYAAELGLSLKAYEKHPEKCQLYGISGGYTGNRGYSIQRELNNLGILKQKTIPEHYLLNSTENRLALLAGLLDSDGHYLVQSNGFEITQKEEQLSRQIKFLCDSLGFRTSLTAKKASIKPIGFETIVYRCRIYGDIDRIPFRIKRNQPNRWKSGVDWQVTDIQVEYDKVDDYYGFEIDGDRLFLLEDMTVTHNTAFTLSLAKNAAVEFNKPVAFFSLEMSSLQLAQRIISMEAEISGMKMRNGQLEDYEWQQLHTAIERIGEAPIFIDDTPGINVFELRAKCRRLKMQHDIQLIMIDYLQLMSGGGETHKGGNREQEVSAISRALKGLAKELNVPVIALSQLSRAVETRGGTKRPQLSDLRESGCLTGDAVLQNAETGEWLTIKDLADREVQTPISVQSLGENAKIKGHVLTKAFYSGKKQVFELKTRNGRFIKASANHPFFKLEGWTRLDNLQVGEKIAVPRQLGIKKPSNPISEDEAILLAHLVGDGCILPKQPYHYTSADMVNILEVNKKVETLFGIKGKVVPQKNWYHTYLKSPFQLTHGKKHPITEWYQQLGIPRVRSYEKELPAGLFQCDDQIIQQFIHHLWSTDGNISWKKLKGRKPSAAIYYASTSQKLALQLQGLLLRLGVLSTLRSVDQGAYRPIFQLHIQGASEQLKFLRKIGCFGERGKIIPQLVEALMEIQPNPNTDTIPKELWDLSIKPLMKEMGITQSQFAGFFGITKSSATYKTSISRERLNRITALIPSQRLQQLAQSDILWDEIVSITPLGVEDVYDATVEDVHNFVANNIVVHNSIEQDADIVSFIYRPEYYQILEDEEGQSLKDVAEIIVAKHRHGALKTVKLRFTAEFARFSDLEDTDFSALPDENFDPASYANIITRPSKMNDEDIPF